MNIRKNYSLINYNSFGVNVKAKEFIEINSNAELLTLKEIIKNKKVIIKRLNPQIYFDYAYIWPEGRDLSALAEEFIIELKKTANSITKIK